MASEGFHEPDSCSSMDISMRIEDAERVGEIKEPVLHQIFVAVSPKLCYAVKQQVLQLKRCMN